MKVTYVGPFADGVEIAATGQVVKPGESVEVDAALGAALCEQPSNWAPAEQKPAKVKTAAAEEGVN